MGELYQTISPTELAEWMVYDQLRPFGLERDDMLTAHICQTIVNINRGRNRPAYKLKDFILFKKIGSIVPKQSVEQMKQILMSMVPKGKRKKDVSND